MKDYSKMSDLEINKAVAKALGLKVKRASPKSSAVDALLSLVEDGTIKRFQDYCNSYEDWEKLLVNKKIDLFYHHIENTGVLMEVNFQLLHPSPTKNPAAPWPFVF